MMISRSCSSSCPAMMPVTRWNGSLALPRETESSCSGTADSGRSVSRVATLVYGEDRYCSGTRHNRGTTRSGYKALRLLSLYLRKIFRAYGLRNKRFDTVSINQSSYAKPRICSQHSMGSGYLHGCEVTAWPSAFGRHSPRGRHAHERVGRQFLEGGFRSWFLAPVQDPATRVQVLRHHFSPNDVF